MYQVGTLVEGPGLENQRRRLAQMPSAVLQVLVIKKMVVAVEEGKVRNRLTMAGQVLDR